ETKFAGVYDQAAQPCSGTTAGIEQPDRAFARRAYVCQFTLQQAPNLPVSVSVRPVKRKELRRISICIGKIILAGLIVDLGDCVRWMLNGMIRGQLAVAHDRHGFSLVGCRERGRAETASRIGIAAYKSEAKGSSTI